MEDNELIWVGNGEDSGACYLSSDEESIACQHYQAKNPLCFGTHGRSEWPCKGLNIVLVKKQEYAIWRLTK